MSFLKPTFVIASLLLSISTHAHADDIKILQKKLKAWQPIEITNKNKSLTVTLPGKEISPDAYSNLIKSGVCTPIWTRDAPDSYLKNVNELSVVNQYKSIGYTFESPLATCKELGLLMDQPSRVLLSSKTRLYTGK